MDIVMELLTTHVAAVALGIVVACLAYLERADPRSRENEVEIDVSRILDPHRRA